ncbi:MAG: hypothetical protein COV55_00730 [Candidatus Komeilibacteria bacterium CG11_big_fil_rev_8_21_14_0_20_36_20]|uniref:Uncharacterized protein n=1 Tax=Candidatus Komeilibacteria bacterium CG11_big_fil_rev_8_21_14_0_20_36_20 TaxID=1974477 RepID=A0A2H0NFT3_9BACT|nr:MAG: hypothetical protein COV55_00730 [Candidatus Komeilibacteria bacterium CG11_big_fil_rev_8_21_14_0_20_36_20]PIR81307.1 MAG: hypothetical protein COU21_03700 [Candidatus Komeilibacteria bacterium CG10_big_fil_rev_8_21_14_0_10_36_65]PJC54937.1 MAG: hypothetical protein CO027_04370 [Candidatus Komeilibacteria bacterium CG_4_9_14_0_2_um_filter_36_13]
MGKFYRNVIKIEPNIAALDIPENVLIVVQRGLDVNQMVAVCQRITNLNYHDGLIVRVAHTHLTDHSYPVPATEDLSSLTLIEYLLLVLKNYTSGGGLPVKEQVCLGSNIFNRVPYVKFYEDRFHIFWDTPPKSK